MTEHHVPDSALNLAWQGGNVPPFCVEREHHSVPVEGGWWCLSCDAPTFAPYDPSATVEDLLRGDMFAPPCTAISHAGARQTRGSTSEPHPTKETHMTETTGHHGRPLGAFAPSLPDPWNPTPGYVQEMPPADFFRHLIRSTDPTFAGEYRDNSDRTYVEECNRRYGPRAFENLTDYIAVARVSVDILLHVLPDVGPFIAAVSGLGLSIPPIREADAAGDRRRQPQANVETFALGHYEQMIVHMAILAATGMDVELTPEHREALRGLRHIFASHGTVTVTRTNQED